MSLMRNFDDIPHMVIEKKTYITAEPPKDAISVSRKGIFTFNTTLKKELIDSSNSKNLWASIKDIDGGLFIKVESKEPKEGGKAKINKKTGIFSAKTILNNSKHVPNLKNHLIGKDTKTIRFEKDGKRPVLEVDSSNKTIVLDTNTMSKDEGPNDRLRFD